MLWSLRRSERNDTRPATLRRGPGFALGVLVLFALVAPGESRAAREAPPATPDATAPANGSFNVSLGSSAVELTGPWRFHTGDDAAWARPEFDDSSWDAVDLAPPAGTADPDTGAGDPIPGWTARGYPGYSGFAWYRLHATITGAETRLALKMPDAVDDAYEVYVNGERIGHFGDFHAHDASAYLSVPQGFRLPATIKNGPVTIAVRMWMDSATSYNTADAGGMHGPPVLGRASAIRNQVQLDWADVTHDVGLGFLEELILVLTLLVAFVHFWMEREDRAFLYLGLVALATLVGNTATLVANYTTVLPQTPYLVLLQVVAAPSRICLWVLFWASWFGLGPSRRFAQVVWGLGGALALFTMLKQPPLYGHLVPAAVSPWLVPLLLTIKLALAALLLWKCYQGIRSERVEGLLALPAIVLAILANYQREAGLIHLPTSFTLFGFNMQMGPLSTILSLLLVTALASRRFLRAQRRSVEWGVEVERARGIQQLLVPKALPSVAGLAIESEYRPAREVGGDFFQIIPGDTDDDGVLIVVGDVTGKGLSAGMLVALIVGILQTTVKDDPDPVAVLHTLNERLCERTQSSATCLAMRITPNGEVMIANAGHLPPYRNGREIGMEGAFPLGIVPGLQFSVARFKLENRDRLVLISDGVAEAQNSDGELFGFDRVSAMLREPISAADLAGAAQRFGQEDDILVLRVERRAGVRVAPHTETTLVFR